MKKIFLFIFALISLLSEDVNAQGADCTTASPFCTAQGTTTFPAGQNTVAPTGPNYGCLGSQPNPAWFYLQIATPGNITLDLSNSAVVDIDYVCWGPFTSPAAGCASGLTGANVDCSYSSSATETCTIPSAVVGEVYVLLITNYSNQATTISLAQNGGLSTGTTSCNIVCGMTALTAVPGACTSPTNIFDLTGTVTYVNPPTAGTLTITNSCSGATQVINAPFNATTATYTLTGLPANAAACNVSAVFSADPSCALTTNFSAPAPCFVNCPIQVDSARVCSGLTATLTASGAAHYLWSNGDTTATITVPGVVGTFSVIGTTGTCKDTAISIVTIFQPPTAIFTADSLAGCDSVRTHFVADTVGNAGATYTWSLGESSNGVGMKPTHLYTTVGCHAVTLTTSLGVGCTTTFTDTCFIRVFPPPVAGFTVAPSEIDILQANAFFNNTSTSSTHWLWNFGDTSSSILENPDHTYLAVGNYNVTLYASSLHGCKDSVTVPVVVKDIITCYIPNAFTPNKNDHNELFNIYSYGLSPKNFELLIFDRWGKQMFKTNDLKEGWNGALNNVGEVMEQAVYVYHVNYVELSGRKHTVIGRVTLLK